MRRLGKVLHLSKTGNLILQLEETTIPNIGMQVSDYKLRIVGMVNNILGPVLHPYVSIQSNSNPENDLTGKILYLVEKI